MKATSIGPGSARRTAIRDVVVFLHGDQLERNLARAAAAEAAGTFVLVLAITSAAVAATLARPVAGAPYGSLAVPVAGSLGLAIAVAIVISGPVSGAGANPARAIGPMILAGQFSDWWAYLTAPLAGGVAAVTLYDRFLRAELRRPPMAAMPVEYQTPAIEDRAVEVLTLLADRGQHRARLSPGPRQSHWLVPSGQRLPALRERRRVVPAGFRFVCRVGSGARRLAGRAARSA
jgi:Major intrinsic protein